MRRLFFIFFACILWPMGIAQEAPTERINALYESVPAPDRTLMRRLDQADRLFEAGRASEAAVMLGGILENANFAFVTPEEASNRTLHHTINDYILDRIRRLPKEARDSYIFQFEPTARRLLHNAVTTGSLHDVQLVARNYFPTPSGASAAFLVGLTQFERGEHTAASLTLERLQRLHPDIPDALVPVLEELLAKLQNDANKSQISESAWLEQTGWRMPSGSPSQNIGTQASAPLLEKNWTVPVFNRLSWERETEMLARTLASRDDAFIPASQPLVVGNLFITRTPGETIAVDANSGKRLWVAPESEYRAPDGSPLPPLPNAFLQNTRSALRLYFWHDRISHQLSSDGERVFSIDEHDLNSNNTVVAFGRAAPQLLGRGEDLRFASGNTLTARDVRTGQILWQAGKFPYVQEYINDLLSDQRAPGVSPGLTGTNADATLFETWFLGAPLPLHGRLYTVGETDGVIYLFAFESQTGRLIARQPFAQPIDSLVLDPVRRTYPLFPSASEGIVIAPSGCGLIVALDAVTLAPLWAYTYAPATRIADMANRNANFMRNRPLVLRAANEEGVRQIFAQSGWQVPSIIIDGQRVLVAPSDRPILFCLDLRTGELLWELHISRPNALYVAGIHNDKAYIITPINMMTIDMITGRNLTTTASRFPEGLKPAGMGVRSGEQYFIPLTDGHLAVANLNDSTLAWLNVSAQCCESATIEHTIEYRSFTSDNPQFGLVAQGIRENDIIEIDRWFGQMHGQFELRGDGIQIQAQWHFGGEAQFQPVPMFAPPLPTQSWRNPPPDTPPPMMDAFFQQSLQLGNLVGIKGRFFSQSPTQITSFDQKEPLRQRVSALLQANANDAEGLLHQGRLHKSEGNLAEAIESFRASLQARHSFEAADFLRRSLLEAMRNDFPAWAHTSAELESLAELPEEKAAILLAQIDGILQSNRLDDLDSIVEKVNAFTREHSILVPVSADHSAQLHLALACMLGVTQRDTQRATDVSLRPSLNEPFLWPSRVQIHAVPLSTSNQPPMPDEESRAEIDRIVNRLVAGARNPVPTRPGDSPVPIPFLGSPGSEITEFNHIIRRGTSGFVFCRTDLAGRELWRVPLPRSVTSGFQEGQFQARNNLHTGEYTTYIKGFQHYLLLVHGNSMIAVDTTPLSERVLWSKTLSTAPVSQQTSLRLSNINQRPNLSAMPFPKRSVFVSPHLVCYWDASTVHGLDPLTGQTLWVRRIHHENCTIIGDEENLFLVFPDARQVIAIDPMSGRELEHGRIPEGGVYIYSTNIVFLQATGNDFTLLISDLRNIHNRRARALLRIDSPTGNMLTETLHEMIRRNAMLQTFENDRFLSVASFETRSLQVYDLLTKERLLPEENTMLDFVSPDDMRMTRCDVTFVGDNFLVLFTKGTQLRNSASIVEGEDGRRVRREFRPIGGVVGVPIDEGVMMLFDSQGNPLWQEPMHIEKMLRLVDVPNRLPVMLFAIASLETAVGSARPDFITRIMGIDKRSGEALFRKEIDASRIPLQPFRVSVDVPGREIIFTNTMTFPPRAIRAMFLHE